MPARPEVGCAATAMNDEAEIAWELFLSVHVVSERLAHLEAKLAVPGRRHRRPRSPRERLDIGCTAGTLDLRRGAKGLPYHRARSSRFAL